MTNRAKVYSPLRILIDLAELGSLMGSIFDHFAFSPLRLITIAVESLKW